MPITSAYLNGERVTKDTFNKEANMFNESDDPAYEECLVAVKWLTAVHPDSSPKSGVCFGKPYFYTQRVTCSLDKQQLTKRKLEEVFNLNFEQILNGVEPQEKIKEEDDELSFPEGKEIFMLHKKKERNKGLIKFVKQLQIKNDPKLHCAVCSFSFIEKYGDLGEGFIEVHHVFPISELKEETKTKIEDLIFVCSNCHRMLHRRRPWLTRDALKKLLQ